MKSTKAKSRKIKPGYYVEKTERYIYLYIDESDLLKGHFIFLAGDKSETNGVVDGYDAHELASRCIYLGEYLPQLQTGIKRLLAKKIK
jgi:hypothetical protein